MYLCIWRKKVWGEGEGDSPVDIFVYYDFKTKKYRISDILIKANELRLGDCNDIEPLRQSFNAKVMLCHTKLIKDLIGIEIFREEGCTTYVGLYANRGYCLILDIPICVDFFIKPVSWSFCEYDYIKEDDRTFIIVECSVYIAMALFENRSLINEILSHMIYSSIDEDTIMSSLKGVVKGV